MRLIIKPTLKSIFASLVLSLAFMPSALGQTTVARLWPPPGAPVDTSTRSYFNIVILGDGYQANELTTKFTPDAQDLTQALSSPLGSSPLGVVPVPLAPLGEYRDMLRIWAVYASSQQSGADDPNNPVVALQVRDTRYNCTYNINGTDRALLPVNGSPASNGPVHSPNGLTTAIADANLLPGGWDVFIVLVNNPKPGGAANMLVPTLPAGVSGNNYCAAYNSRTAQVGLVTQLHELGHVMGNLDDEYNDETPGPPLVYTAIPPQRQIVFGINVWFPGHPSNTSNPGTPFPNWQPWIDPPLSILGAPVPGGLGFDTNIFHPEQNCLMNRLFLNANGPPGQGPPNGLCRICVEQMIKRIYNFGDPFRLYNPPLNQGVVTVPQGQTKLFSLDHMGPAAALDFFWRTTINGQTQVTSPTSRQFLFDSAGLPVNQTATISAVARDQNSAVQNPAGGILTTSLSWNVRIVQAFPDLSILSGSLGSMPQSVPAGSSNFSIVGTVMNQGTGPSAAFAVEYFLTTSPATVNPNTDILIYRHDVPGLARNAIDNMPLTAVTIPHTVPPNTYYLGAIVDRLGVTGDSDPSNNVRVDGSTGIAVGAPTGCPSALEFQQALTLPTEAGVSAAAGANLPIVITASCSPGATYIVSISATGTSPGVPMPGGAVLPIVWDWLTDYGLSNINVRPLTAFMATLNASGGGTATFNPLPNSLPPGFNIYCAAALLTNSPVVGVTNAVRIKVGQ